MHSKTPGTGLWICRTKEYQQWHDSPDHGSLWIKGVPGAGKSVVAASLISHLKTTENVPVLFFFFRDIVSSNFTPRSLLQDWLAQLLPHSPRLQAALEPTMKTPLAEVSDSELVDYILDGLSTLRRVYCVADALDEMATEIGTFLSRLNSLATHHPASVKLLMTSRPKRYLQSALRDSSIVHISSEQSLVDEDIISYLQHRFDQGSPSDSHLSLKEDVVNMVATKSGGLFLYAKLMMDQLGLSLQSPQSFDIAASEKTLPAGLRETYFSILEKQRDLHTISTELQRTIFESVISAAQPLRLNELASLLELIFPDLQRDILKPTVARACGPLVEILEDETLQICHHSLTEILRGDDGGDALVNPSKAHEALSRNCLSYVMQHLEPMRYTLLETPTEPVSTEERRHTTYYRTSKDGFDYQSARLQHPFLKYAVDHWSLHASRANAEAPRMFHIVEKFCEPENLVYRRWVSLTWGLTAWNREGQGPLPNALHIAAYSGMTTLAERLLLEKHATVDAQDFQCRTPLHWAALRGHTRMVALLLKNSALPAPADICGLTPLHLAARHDRAAVIELLVTAGADMLVEKTQENHPGGLLGGETITKGETPIFYICHFGHLDSIRALLPHSSSDLVAQMLCESLINRRKEAAQIILDESDVSGNVVYHGGTALYFACSRNHIKAVQILISRGADVNATSNWNHKARTLGASWQKESATPLQALVKTWSHENHIQCTYILQMLLEAGADIEKPDAEGATPLLIAAGSRLRYGNGLCLRSNAIEALLKAGADTRKRDSQGDSVIHRVLSVHRDPNVVRILLEHGFGVNSINGSGQTALHLVLEQTGTITSTEHTNEIVTYLLDHGADADLKDAQGAVPLTFAASERKLSLEAFQKILDSTHDMSAKTRCLYTLNQANGHEHAVACIKLLQAEGVDINTTEVWGQTPLMTNLSNTIIFRALRDCGAKLDALDVVGRNALHIVCMAPPARLQRLKQLVEEGLDPLHVDHRGNTLLHQMMPWYSGQPQERDQVHFLAKLGISINAKNKGGRTPLHVHIESGRVISSHNTKTIITLLDAFEDLDEKIDVNALDGDGLTPLHLAALRSEDWVLRLLVAGADPLILAPYRRNLLHLAARARQSNILGYLLQRTGDQIINQMDDHGRTPLHDACASGIPETVFVLLRAGADAKIRATGRGMSERTVLHACAEFAEEQRMCNSISQDSYKPPDRLRPNAGRPFHGVPWYRSLYSSAPHYSESDFARIGPIVKMVLDADVDLMAHDNFGHNALDNALSAGLSDMVDPLIQDERYLRAVLKIEDRRRHDTEAQVGARISLVKAQCALLRRGGIRMVQQPELREQISQSPWCYLQDLGPNDLRIIVKEREDTSRLDLRFISKLLRPLLTLGLVEHLEACKHLLHTFHDSSLVKETIPDQADHRQSKEDFQPALHQACSRSMSNLQMLQFLVEICGVDVNMHAVAVNPSLINHEGLRAGPVALHVLSSANHWWHLEAIRYLVTHGADVNAVDEHGDTPLHKAAPGRQCNNMSQESGTWRAGCVKLLLSLGADPNVLNKAGLTPLHRASTAPRIMRNLLENGADATTGTVSPVFMAIQSQDWQALEVMLDAGVSVNVIDVEGKCQASYKMGGQKRYALLCAAWLSDFNRQAKDSVPLVQMLVKRGADLYVPVSNTETLINCIFENAAYCIVDALLSEPCASQIDFNHRDQRGRTVLMAAANWSENLPGYNYEHRMEKVEGPCIRIMKAGVDTTAVDEEGKTVLHHILNNPDIEDDTILQLIHRKEAQSIILTKDKQGYTPLHYATRLLRPKAVTALISRGADLHESDPEGNTTLHHIARQCLDTRRPSKNSSKLARDQPEGFFDICAEIWDGYLLGNYSINVSNNKADTPLHVYISSEVMYSYSAKNPKHTRIDRYERLFPASSCIDVRARNNDGETMLHVLARRKRNKNADEVDKAMFEFMMKKGLDPLEEDAKGRSSLDVASACGRSDILDIFGRK